MPLPLWLGASRSFGPFGLCAPRSACSSELPLARGLISCCQGSGVELAARQIGGFREEGGGTPKLRT